MVSVILARVVFLAPHLLKQAVGYLELLVRDSEHPHKVVDLEGLVLLNLNLKIYLELILLHQQLRLVVDYLVILVSKKLSCICSNAVVLNSVSNEKSKATSFRLFVLSIYTWQIAQTRVLQANIFKNGETQKLEKLRTTVVS